jgi:hypothetical protein
MIYRLADLNCVAGFVVHGASYAEHSVESGLQFGYWLDGDRCEF